MGLHSHNLLNRKEKNMTKTLSLRALDVPSLHKFGIGFDRMFDEFQRLTEQQGQVTYPPHNIIKLDDNNFVIELAVAGFTEGEIDIQVEKNVLTIKGSKIKDLDAAPKEYLVKMIGTRDFERVFTLAEYVEVTNATVVNGILAIDLERKIPEAELPKRIAIHYTK
jgi:molecular chaperone IbpA